MEILTLSARLAHLKSFHLIQHCGMLKPKIFCVKKHDLE